MQVVSHRHEVHGRGDSEEVESEYHEDGGPMSNVAGSPPDQEPPVRQVAGEDDDRDVPHRLHISPDSQGGVYSRITRV